MTTKTNPLVVMELRCKRLDRDGIPLIDDMLVEARNAVAELVQADKAYDEAKAAHRKARNCPWNGEQRATAEKLSAAWIRRAAALAAFEQQP